MATEYNRIIKDGLWGNNAVLNMFLGLCPAMAVTTSATNGLGLGLATLAVLCTSSVLVAILRNLITKEVRIPVYILIVASMVTMVDLSMNAWVHELYKVLGIFIALIVVNCIVLARLESFASKESVTASLVDGLSVGIGFTMSLVVIGGLREIMGQGTLFADASLLLGPAFKFLEMRILPPDSGMLMMILPPGGFLVVAHLVVLKRLIDARAGKNEPVAAPHPA
ncbi:MAG: electron transport complex subunit E [Rhodocyclaceae bacterium]|nr:MAG: electron transport complex subunit E [Rhodocyclaceae bacterium]